MSDTRDGLYEGLLGELPSGLRKALEHPCRRQILRALEADERLSAYDLVKARQIPCPLSCASYHLRYLEARELVEAAGIEEDRGAIRHYFASAVGDREGVRQVLQALEGDDRGQLAHAGC